MLSIPPFHPAFNPNKEVVTHMMEDARRIIDDSIRAPCTARWKGGVLTAPSP